MEYRSISGSGVTKVEPNQTIVKVTLTLPKRKTKRWRQILHFGQNWMLRFFRKTLLSTF